MREPSAVFVQSGDDLIEARRNGLWSAGGVEVGWNDGTVEVTADSVTRVALRWTEPLPSGALILGDAWERSYGDLQWRHQQPDRLLPWYFLAHDPATGRTTGAGVEVHPNAFARGPSTRTASRSGSTSATAAARPSSTAGPCKQLPSSRFDDAGTPWQTLDAAVATMSSRLPARPEPAPVVGANNWYYAYGENFDEKAVLTDAATIVELADGHPVKPFSVVDDGWYPGGIASGGPWDNGIPGVFDDLSGTAASIREIGARPGLWFRPLLVREADRHARSGPHDKPGRALDPSYPEVLDLVRNDLTRFKDWGFELVKHDFSTYDVFGRFRTGDGRPADRRAAGSCTIRPGRPPRSCSTFYREIRSCRAGRRTDRVQHRRPSRCRAGRRPAHR